MYLNKLLLKSFGKFNNKEIVLKPGINVISGKKDSGKSTIKDFIVSMLFGFSNCALNEKNNKFESYKPHDGRVYSGKANLKDDDKTYFVERSFAKKNSRTNVLELNSGRDVQIENDSLDGRLFKCCRDDFVNGLCIDNKDDDYEGYIKHDFSNMIVSGAASVELNKSIFYLKKKRKEFDTSAITDNIDIIDSELEDFEDVDARLKSVRKKMRDIEENLAIETARRKREARRLIQSRPAKEDDEKEEESSDKKTITESVDESKVNSEQTSDDNAKADDNIKEKSLSASEDKSEEVSEDNIFLNADLLKDYKPEVKLTDRIWFIILTGIFVVGIIAAIVYILPFDNAVRQIFIICTILFVIVTIVEGLYAKGVFDEDVRTPSEEEFKRIIYELERKTETYEEVEIDMSFAKEFLDKREELADEERMILKDMARRDELKEEKKSQEAKLDKAKKEIHAINLAINTINDLSKDISKSYSYMINNNVSDIISKLTNNKFNDLYINENNKPMVMSQSGYVDFDSLDDNDMRQIYLSIRFAIAKSMLDKNMPVILDGIFDGLENNLLANAIDIVRKFSTSQIIILSSDYRVENRLKELNTEYNLIALD
ncbi:MAG: AAA family ATPase [Lachnospiraceae bacterium]|nr:AAA family ATPase [Lachnospiraceae bacterium]